MTVAPVTGVNIEKRVIAGTTRDKSVDENAEVARGDRCADGVGDKPSALLGALAVWERKNDNARRVAEEKGNFMTF